MLTQETCNLEIAVCVASEPLVRMDQTPEAKN